MTQRIVVGQLATVEGLVQWGDGGNISDIAFIPASAYRAPRWSIPFLVGHDPEWQVGEVLALHRSARGLLCACLYDAPAAVEPVQPQPHHNNARTWDLSTDVLAGSEGTWSLSAGVTTEGGEGRRSEFALLREVSLTRHPAGRGLKPVVVGRADSAIAPRELPLLWDAVWQAGKDRLALSARRREVAPVEIVEVDSAPASPERSSTALRSAPRPSRKLSVRLNGQDLSAPTSERLLVALDESSELSIGEIVRVLGLG